MTWPGINSITYSDGRITLLDVEFYGDHNYFIGPIADTTLESYLKYNEDNLSNFDFTQKIVSDGYEIAVGDGSGESNGIIYVWNLERDELAWFGFFENSEPFKSVTADKQIVKAVAANGICWAVDISDPLKIQIIYPPES